MTFRLKLRRRNFGFAALAAAFALMAIPLDASARDTFTKHGVMFDKEWYDANIDGYDYTPLEGVADLYDAVMGLNRIVTSFKIKDSYCKPPLAPQKSRDRRMLDEFWKILGQRRGEYSKLLPLAVMVQDSSQAADYTEQANYLTASVIYPYISEITHRILDMRKELSDAPELDCSKKNQESAMRMRNSEMLAALNGARQSNPHTQRREVALPGQTGTGLDVLSRANQGSSNARTNSGRSTTTSGRQPSNQNSSLNRTANLPTNQPVNRETGDATGIFSPTSRTETPIARETGDSTGIFNRNTRVDTPVMRETGTDTGIFNRNLRVDTPLMRETGDATGVFSQGGQRELLQPTSRALSFPTSKSGAFTSRVGSSVEFAGEREAMTEPNY